ncbi:DUF3099 domain-containing protein [Pseudonocardia sp. KRD-184]|uniref:DUF3099 domain-containing protein n=1 Tax=Pseudonocardia oceani TaxID=2792013 RepID=A0ABS6UGM5_9PSEU|nr:DUF3099 domain-containing protein [Pseudonocardia oceani]MBW0098470.1 DUF3099 domain-containing protein [Pseudonocardia oceani]MBW0109925.1 DUF3099 domain-containing protein [Pseudonocardia oceani]MBW0120368.1 DUF3099 domain-containing protein [Pseudonocardia oceani]MBW0131378.1 DUF3099 domain-containing protein [Pseudonocardia oceani]
MDHGGRVARFPWSPLIVSTAGEGARSAQEGVTVADPQHAANPVLITDAAMSYEEELAARKHRYKIMMGMRIPLMVLAGVFYTIPWLAVALLVISIPLPWMAVLIANDRLPKKREEVSRFRADRPQIEAPAPRAVEHRVIDQED